MEQNQGESIYLAALAGLLHDVGKFAQRAGTGASRTWDREAENEYKYRHALLTADFIEAYVPAPWKMQVKHLAANHHRPQNIQEQIIQLADHLSAGECAPAIDPIEDDRAIHPRQMQSIFCSLAIPDAQGQLLKAPQTRYLSLAPLALQAKTIFPQEPIEEASDVWAAYLRLWDHFCENVQRLGQAHQNRANLAGYFENFLLLFQQFTWCVPAAYYQATPDISLYDHGRMTSALAAVLSSDAWDIAEMEQLSLDPSTSDYEVALLVAGDLGGIQAFLYTLTSRGANSGLRGRSLYLSLLTEAVVRYILDRLGLPLTNLIYAGGGNFYLLARPRDLESLPGIQADISRLLFQHHRGDLYMALSHQLVKARDFYNGALSEPWDEIIFGLQQAKWHRFQELGDEMKNLFQPQGLGGNQEHQCQVCGREYEENRIKDDDPTNLEWTEVMRTCPVCCGYESLGRQLRSANYLSLEHLKPVLPDRLHLEQSPGDWRTVLAALGMGVELLEEPVKNHRRLRTVLAIKDSALSDLHPAAKTIVGRRFLVNVTPIITDAEIESLHTKGMQDLPEDGSIKPFSAMAAQSQGIQRLGVLRMDVDNMGKIFSQGLGEGASLIRIASLSSAISLFFEGWVEVLAENRNRGGQGDPRRGELLYSIYAGGDDLFFVGAWDEIVELARQIRADLTLYAANHPGITASAGIVLVDGKYPLSQAAKAAYLAEARAKNLRWQRERQIRDKDGVAFLDQTLPWAAFGLEECTLTGLESAHALMHLLVHLVTQNESNRSLLGQLVRLHEQQQEALEDRKRKGIDTGARGQQQALWGPWQWLGFYTLTRLARQTGSAEIDNLCKKMKDENFRSLEWAGLAARWAELWLRCESKAV